MPAAHTDWFTEEMGLAAESDGLSRIAGRLFGYLLLASEPRSLDDIAAALDVSKASISTESRRLLDKGVVHRIGRPGDRRDYYSIAPDFFESLMRHRVERWRRLGELGAELQRTHPKQGAAVKTRLKYMTEIDEFITGRIDAAFAAWHARGPSKPAKRKAKN